MTESRMTHRGPAAIQSRDKIRQLDVISARHDSPDGGLAAIRAKNQADAQRRQLARDQDNNNTQGPGS